MGLDNDNAERVLHEVLVLGDLTVRDFRQSADEPGYAIGSCTIAGTMFHVEALRVKRDENDCQIGSDDPHDRYADVCALDENAFQTIEIHGLEGDWVLWVRPFCE